MDDKISAVLDTYHDMIRDEREQRRQGKLTRPREGERDSRLLAVGPETGQLINILARSLKAPTILELGTSYGYSGIWLAEAARASGGRVVTMEMFDYKSDFAREMAEKAGLASYMTFMVGDAVQMISELPTGIDFVLVDLADHLYLPCLAAFRAKLNPGAIVVADNIGSNRGTVDYVQTIRAVSRIESLHLPVGNGLEISRVTSA